jgi:hypothetical protein
MNITLKLEVVGRGHGKTKGDAVEMAFASFMKYIPVFVVDEGDNQYFLTELSIGGMYVFHAEKWRSAPWVKSGSGWQVRVYKLPRTQIATVQQHARHFTFTTK